MITRDTSTVNFNNVTRRVDAVTARVAGVCQECVRRCYVVKYVDVFSDKRVLCDSLRFPDTLLTLF
jgi:hypothetical protein